MAEGIVQIIKKYAYFKLGNKQKKIKPIMIRNIRQDR